MNKEHTQKAQVFTAPAKQNEALAPIGVFQDSKEFFLRTKSDIPRGIGHHIYFTTDKGIKEATQIFHILSREIGICNTVYGNGYSCSFPSGTTLCAKHNCKKILACTDRKLYGDVWFSIAGNPPELEGDIACIGEEFIQAFVREKGNIKEVLLEIEKVYRDTSEIIGADGTLNGLPMVEQRLKLRSNGTVIIHAEKKQFTETELYENMQYYMEYCQINGYVTPQKWLAELKHF